ncbi:bile acid:sodium symporter family protein [Celerinatantimonas yamalensis]|uniref:Bile acid:sodium symporter family protein n=1 Tax=Celerinatantimonas yamalensis TaxID=559956 RepID=A0ABW9G7R2_9GAMM
MIIWQKLKKEWFLFGMLIAIGLAILIPHWGSSVGPLHLNIVTQYGIALVFLLHGIALSPKDIRQGMSNWGLHIYTQAATFVLYPLIWLLFGHYFQTLMPQPLAYGFCYLLVLPSTISSSVAMTAIAKGNIPGAIFNASLSSVLGIFLTPLYVKLFIGLSNGHMDIEQTVLHIAYMLLLPMVLGQLLRPLIGEWMRRYKSITGKLDKFVILLIIFNAFSDSVIRGIWHDFELSTLLLAIVLCCIILTVVMLILFFVAKWIKFNDEDFAAGLFCGTKKTLAAGVPMAKVIFGASPILGMLLLPIMLYHPIQIFVCAIIANRLSTKAAQNSNIANG